MIEKIKNDHYYGSDLNKFIDERCSREMTCNNIDCALLKMAQRRIRFIESKHYAEGMPKSQRQLLEILKWVTDHPEQKEWKLEYFIVVGNYPYRNGANILEIGKNKTYSISNQALVDWLNFREELL